MASKTNKYPGECTVCGETVPAGKGELHRQWSGEQDEWVWTVRHTDESVCVAVAAEDERASKCAATLGAIKGYIKAYGTEQIGTRQIGKTILHDGRKGYNAVGDVISYDDDGNLYLTVCIYDDPGSFGNSVTTLTGGDDDGYGNSNADIIRILRDLAAGQPAKSLSAFAL